MAEYNPKKIRVRDGWCVVKMDERKEQLASGLFLPANEAGVEKVDTGSATLIRVGQGEKNSTIGLEAGQRVALRDYFKHANPIPTEEGHYFVVHSDDIEMILPPGIEVGVFSSPANPISEEK